MSFLLVSFLHRAFLPFLRISQLDGRFLFFSIFFVAWYTYASSLLHTILPPAFFDIDISPRMSDGSFILLAYTSCNGQPHVHERDVLMPQFRCISLYLLLETMVGGFYIASSLGSITKQTAGLAIYCWLDISLRLSFSLRGCFYQWIDL